MVRRIRIGIVHNNRGWLTGRKGERARGSDRVRTGAEGITQERCAREEDIGGGHVDGRRRVLSDEKSGADLGGEPSRDIQLEQVGPGKIGIPSLWIDG